MATPAKMTAVLTGHRTKAEKELREQGEKSLLTGKPMTEYRSTKDRPGAHRYFGRVRRLMGLIGRDDAIHEQVINRYCVLLDECDGVADELKRADAMLNQADDAELYEKLIGHKLKLEQTLDKKRDMLLKIEKENLLTVASGLRAIPKTPQKDEDDPMAALLARRG